MLDRRRTLRTPGELAAAGLIAPEQIDALEPVAARYAVAITPAIADLIDTSDPDDPIAKQFVPTQAVLASTLTHWVEPVVLVTV